MPVIYGLLQCRRRSARSARHEMEHRETASMTADIVLVYLKSRRPSPPPRETELSKSREVTPTPQVRCLRKLRNASSGATREIHLDAQHEYGAVLAACEKEVVVRGHDQTRQRPGVDRNFEARR